MTQGPWRLIFLGTPAFALPSLEALLESGEDVQAVVTQPDRPRGRGQKVSPTPVKELAQAWKVPVFQPLSLKDPALVEALSAFQPALMIVVAYGRILTHEILALPTVGFLNVHASLLPRYRGPAPINWAIINGDRETGVTIQWVKYEVDTGEIFLQERLPILEEDNAGTLARKLSERGAVLLVKALEMLRRGEPVKLVQDESLVNYAPMITKEMRRLDLSRPAAEVAGWIRGLDPAPGAHALWRGRVLKLFGGRVRKTAGRSAPPGTVLRLGPRGLEIACGQGSVTVAEVQQAGHRRLTAVEFLRGQALLGQVLE